ncbi:MAG: cation:proton antiporter [Dehalococcoidia bacterium]|nr:cation:proton antiporter [Dehalococcoidia bacterium]
MDQSSQAINFAILLTAALVGGMVAHRLKQPIILGYLGVGVGIGPYALGLVNDVSLVEAVATVGVALLMFTLGLEISPLQLKEAGKVGYLGGPAQIMITSGLGFVAAVLVFDWSASEAVVFGLVISLSSTMVCLKILMDRGEMDSVHGRIMVAILILQDIAAVFMVLVIPALNGETESLSSDLLLATGKAILFIGVVIILGLWILPWLLGSVGGVRSRELFLLTIIVLCLGTALGTYILGLSVSFGAFVIGLALHESKFGHRALAEIIPLRDIFAALFFVSLGMLLDPGFVVDNWWLTIQAVMLIIFIKFVAVFGIVWQFGFNKRIALLAGAGLFQIGEFGFILAQIGVNMDIISADSYSLILASALITMMLTPFGISSVSWLYSRFYPIATTGEPPAGKPAGFSNEGQVIIAGYGRVGRHLARGLRDAAIPFTVVEINPGIISDLRSNQVSCIYGDASNIHVLDRLNLAKARALVVTYPDPVAVVTTVRTALALSPNIQVLARVHRTGEANVLQRIGVSEMVSPEYEASFRLLKRLLNISGLKADERKQILSRMREKESIAKFSSTDEED